MADTTFVAVTTKILAAWLNAVNNWVYRGARPTFGTTTGAANVYVLTLPATSLYTAVAEGDTFIFTAHQSNPGAATFSVVGGVTITAAAIQLNGAALAGNEIRSGGVYQVTRVGAVWQIVGMLQSPLPVSLGGTGATTAAAARTALDVPSNAEAILDTIIDAAGDLIVGTAADTAGILPASASPAAHATTCNIWAARYNTLTGGIVTFTDVADAPYAGAWSVVVANAAHIFTDGANIEVMGNANYTCTAGDVLLFTAKTTTTFQMSVLKEDGKPVVGITLGTEQASTSGTSIDFTGIPSGVKRITIMFNGTSTSGTSPIMIQIGDSGGVETSGYNSNVSDNAASTNSTAGFIQLTASVAAGLYRGTFVLDLEDSSDFTWIGFGNLTQDGSAKVNSSAGGKALSATLDRVRITTVNGSDTFDAGAINISYQS